MKSPSEIALKIKNIHSENPCMGKTPRTNHAFCDCVETKIVKAITTERQRQERLVEAFEEVLEFVEQLTHDPYSKDLFKEPPDSIWKELDEFMKTKGLRIDNLSADYGRVFRKPIIEDATRILAEAQQVLKEVK